MLIVYLEKASRAMPDDQQVDTFSTIGLLAKGASSMPEAPDET